MRFTTTLVRMLTVLALACCVATMMVAQDTVTQDKARPLNQLTPEEQREGFVLLFDGKTLSTDLWQGAIEGYPVDLAGFFFCKKGGNLLTKNEYSDFIFRFEFRLPPGGNNGLGIRCDNKGNAAFESGMELQILDNYAPQYATLKPYQYHGSIYGVVPSKRNADKNDYLKPTGEWNYEEVIATGTRIKVILNGEVIVDADLSDFKEKPFPDEQKHDGLFREKGFIGFLGHGDPVAFRNIRVKAMPPKKQSP